MDKLRIVGGRPLLGTIAVSGAKNAALPELCAALLTAAPVELRNVPRLRDVATMRKLLENMGVQAETHGERGGFTLQAPTSLLPEAPYELVKTMRASVLALGPLLILIALAVKLDSPGPVFFRQERVGRFGVPFRIHKFRTMSVEAAGSGLQITVGADRRITRVGQFLRASKLDELPQLIDVWQGTMSLVGPRPEVPRYVGGIR